MDQQEQQGHDHDHDHGVSSFFICPISLQLMKDPVTISTGITYDRDSITTWLFSYNHTKCPVTNKLLSDYSLTPNSTLLRLIQSWQSINNPSQIPTIKTDSLLITFNSLIQDLQDNKKSQIKALREIKSIIQDNNTNYQYWWMYMEKAGVALLLSSLLVTKTHDHHDDHVVWKEAIINVFYLLKPSEETLKRVSQENKGLLIDTLCLSIQQGSYQARIESALLLKSIFEVVDQSYKSVLRSELFEGITEILKDQNSVRLAAMALSILLEVMPFGRNKIKAVEAGVVAVLVELLAESSNKRECEVMLEALGELCVRAEGRSAFLKHPAGVAVVAAKIMRVSRVGDEKALKVLLMVCRFCKGGGVPEELVEVGGVAKLVMVMQMVECNLKTKEKAKEILRSHLQPWMESSSNFSTCFIA